MSEDSAGSVMVVGAGIAGIQASLDLADSGYFVYLVEKKSAIGGSMAQLDKTFPTNDCSMCIISPKLVECGRHLNIELLTMTDIEEVKGGAGNFKVKILENPRYIDIDKCTACSECQKVCPIETPDLFDQGLRQRNAAYKLYPQAMPSAFAIEKKGTSPCKFTCPANVGVQGYIALINEGKYAEAMALFKQEHPFPGVTGRVCHHPCETACTRNEVDKALDIRSLHRFLGDWEIQNSTSFVPEKKESRNERVAVIGSGPAGLTCAYFLAIEGYKVTVFEKWPVLGGMLTVGIPAYRLPREIINTEIQTIKDLGVDFKTGVEIGKNITIAQLREEGFQAFFMAIGAHECKSLGIEGEDLAGVLSGIDFLREVNLGNKTGLGDRVAVIGGGNVAMDSVRTAFRTGSAKPFVVYRRTFEEMPANREEIEECREEGIEIMTLTGPLRILGENGKVTGIECIRMELGKPDASGRRRPLPVQGSEFIIEADTVISAIGQESDWACLTPECSCTLSDWGTISVDSVTLQTGDPDIFAGGDAATGPQTVIEAIAAGKRAAVSIDRFIREEDLSAGRESELTLIDDIPVSDCEKIPRTKMLSLDPDKRLNSFEEVQLGFDEDLARKEAHRCIECGICSECYLCVDACLADAVNHQMKSEERIINVGSIILSPGLTPFDPTKYETYNYANLPNVVTSLEFERLLSASGPNAGHLLRPSDNREPERIAWLQCVGSRDINQCDHSYCSAVCCMYTNKQTVIAKEHSNIPLDTAVFFMDMRTPGKGFEEYHNRAKENNGVRFIRSRIHSVFPAEDDCLKIHYATESGKQTDEIFDMVVLSIGLAPVEGAVELSEKMSIDLNPHGFAATNNLTPVSTSREGIFVCGAFQGPKDIPQSVMQASAAASFATQELADVRDTMTRSKELPPEIDFTDQEPRIGVFVCNCGVNIGGIADVPAVAKYAKSLPNVVYTDENLFTCSQDTQDSMKQIIKENNINRVVVAACSPRTHEPLFQETIRDIGLNKYLFEMANIRDQNTWVHMDDPDKATEKAKDLVRMAVAKAAFVEPLHQVELGIKKAALIVGGGVAGMEAALGIANQGLSAYLVEKSEKLGGIAGRLSSTWQGEPVKPYLKGLIKQVGKNPHIQVFLETEVKATTGTIGNFTTTIVSKNGDKNETSIEHGAVILATGGQEYQPKEYLYGKNPDVLTHLEFDDAIANNVKRVSDAKTTVFIQCVGSRIPERPYCSKICCTHSLKSAMALKKMNPSKKVFILYRDIRSDGFREDIYREARESGVIFVRYDLDHLPEITEDDNNKLTLKVIDHVLARELQLTPDLVVLAAAVLPNDNRKLFELLKVPVNSDGFLVEAHAKLRPVEFASDSLFMAGLAHYPKFLDESIAQAKAAVSRAMTILSKESIPVGGSIAAVNSDLCAACLTCVRTCPYGIPHVGLEEGHALIEPAECHGCGACVSECPGKAITLNHFTDEQIIAKTDALFEEVS